jgi:hypothetical protein
MQRLIYTSEATAQTDPWALEAILAISTKRNSEAGVTGMLWSNGESFAQVLEGDRKAVDATMERIRADPRHTKIDVVFNCSVLSRQFGTWAMVLANDDYLAAANTAFMIGFSLGERTPSAEKLRKVILKSVEAMA